VLEKNRLFTERNLSFVTLQPTDPKWKNSANRKVLLVLGEGRHWRRQLRDGVNRAVMQWVLKILRKHGLAQGPSVCIDATTLPANAAIKETSSRRGRLR
jgi:hypothetical protein